MVVVFGGYVEYCILVLIGIKFFYSNLIFEEGVGVGILYYIVYRVLVIMLVLIFLCLKNCCKNLLFFVGRIIFKDMIFCFL